VNPLDPSLYELPFDQYQRYALVARVIEHLEIPAGARVLDVGGGPGPIERFLPEHRPIVVDMDKSRHGRFVNADGAFLPFASDTFDAVLSFDTLEHIPATKRLQFLSELLRVSRDVVIVAAPFATEHVELAESAVEEFFSARFGMSHPILLEHREFGLPDLATSDAVFREAGWTSATIPSGYLPRWLAAMLVHEDLRASGLPDLPKLHAFYNRHVETSDAREPAYRHVIVARRSGESATLAERLRDLVSDGDAADADAAVQAIAGAVFAQRLGGALHSGERVALEQDLDTARHQVETLERTLADREAHLIELRGQRDALADEVEHLRTRLTERVLQRLKHTFDRSSG